MASGWALLNELLMISSSLFAAVGWYWIRRKREHVHRKMMITAASLGGAFFVSYALGTLIIGDSTFGGPARYALVYQIILQVHVLLATAAAVMGVITILLALKGRFPTHRKLAPWTAVFWFISAATGLVVYLLLFIVFPPGPTIGNVWHVISSSH